MSAETPSHNLLVLGSQNAKPKDQELVRSEIRPVQILQSDGRIASVDFFNDWGEVGVSSIAWNPPKPRYLWVSVNDAIYRLNLSDGSHTDLQIPDLDDIHDIHLIDGMLWISNTGEDEVIGYDTGQMEIQERISLESYRRELDELTDGEAEYEEVKDRFHCNQLFRSFEGDRCILVHHISGWQYLRVLYEMLVKSQGDGGIINLDSGEVTRLQLQSPHTVRKINGHYWLQDSGDFTTKIYDPEWNKIDEFDVGGFGRGMAADSDRDTGYIGVSTTRKRYLKLIPGRKRLPNRVHVITLSNRTITSTHEIPHIEQLDNVYILTDYLMKKLQQLNA